MLACPIPFFGFEAAKTHHQYICRMRRTDCLIKRGALDQFHSRRILATTC